MTCSERRWKCAEPSRDQRETRSLENGGQVLPGPAVLFFQARSSQSPTSAFLPLGPVRSPRRDAFYYFA